MNDCFCFFFTELLFEHFMQFFWVYSVSGHDKHGDRSLDLFLLVDVLNLNYTFDVFIAVGFEEVGSVTVLRVKVVMLIAMSLVYFFFMF